MKNLLAAAVAALLAFAGSASAQTLPNSGSSNSLGVTSVGSCLTRAGGQLNVSAGTPNKQTGASYTIQATDQCSPLYSLNSGAAVWTLPAASSTGFTTGFGFGADDMGGALSLTPHSGTINGQSTLLLLPNQGCAPLSDGSNYLIQAGCTATFPANVNNFLGGSLPSGLTFTRSGSVASDYNNAGIVVTGIAANTPRFDFNPTTFAENGLLVEQPNTNLVLNSPGMLTGYNHFGSNNPAYNAGTAPDGTDTAVQIISNSSSGGGVYTATTTVSNSTVYTSSGYEQWVSGPTTLQFSPANGVTINFNGQTCSYISSVGVTGYLIQQLPAPVGGSNWCRVFGTWTSTGTGVNVSLGAAGTGTTVNLWGPQLNLGTVYASFTPTGASTVTQNLDSVIASNPSWLSTSGGAILVQALVPVINAGRSTTLVSLNDGTASNQIKIILTSTGVPEAQMIIAGTAYTSGGSLSAVTPGTTFRAAISFKSGANSFAANGTLDSAGAFGTASLPSGITQETIGDDGAGAQTLNGWEREVENWGISLPSAAVQAISTLPQ